MFTLLKCALKNIHSGFLRVLKKFCSTLKLSPCTEGSRKYYDFWDEWTNQDREPKSLDRIEPKFSLLGSGTDHAAFAFFANIPAINLRFKDDTKKYKGVGQYPMYHTGYETFYLMDKLIDPGFKIHRTCAQTSLHVLMELADSSILPYNLERFPASMKETLAVMAKNNVTKQLMDNGAGISHLIDAVDTFEMATKKFMEKLENLKNRSSYSLAFIGFRITAMWLYCILF